MRFIHRNKPPLGYIFGSKTTLINLQELLNDHHFIFVLIARQNLITEKLLYVRLHF